ncbi:MAG: polysaccharide deacetylase family protein [Oscillospiraceae bacterium]|nr:polysaccharide deacetylase family protein [Oscillospiraceae bacterium]
MKHRKLIGAAAACAVMASSLPAAAQPLQAAETPDKVIALTFDDGPNTTTTNEILDLLEEYNAVASFFLIGDNINAESAVTVKRAYDMGCEINNHSKTHSNMPSMTAEEMQAEIAYVDDYVYEITGEYTKFFRPPFIDTNQNMFEVIDQPFIGGFGCYDYMENVTAEDRANAVLDAAKDGLIVLLHDAAGNDQTVEALKTIIPELIADGYEFVTLTELFERQGETPKGNLLYNEVAKYPCADYSLHTEVFSGEATGDPSWAGWSDTAVLDRELLAELGDSYAIEVEYEGSFPPQAVLQKWSGETVWQTIQPAYSNGERACIMAQDILYALEACGVDYADLDRMTITPSNGSITMTRAAILTKTDADTPLAGDVNADGKLDVKDVILLQKYLLGLEELTQQQAENAALHPDDAVNAYDLAILKKMLTQNGK